MRHLTFIPLRDFEELTKLVFYTSDVDVHTGDVDFDQLREKSGLGSLCFCCNNVNKKILFWGDFIAKCIIRTHLLLQS